MSDRKRTPEHTLSTRGDDCLHPMLSRRALLAGTAGFGLATILSGGVKREARADQPAAAESGDLPRLDLHVHLDDSTIDEVLKLSVERNVKFGIVEHAGTKENIYPVVLHNDEALLGYLAMLEGKPVYRGVQTEWHDWHECFSVAALSKLDYILTDAMTFPGKDGRRVKLWEPDAPERVDMADREAFMDRYVDWYVAIIEKQPIDIMANTSWLPAPLAADYETFWTVERIRRVADTAVKHRVALEISSGFKLPSLRFLQVAKEAGVKFSFGSNGRYPRMGKLEFSFDMARQLGLTPGDIFTLPPDGQKAAERWAAGTRGKEA
ncbi:MAG: hypothetical protein U1E05_08610 [Patescibacteria group bacterium]|nr:hypothetical protein [Patescibacteria group bacterium]